MSLRRGCETVYYCHTCVNFTLQIYRTSFTVEPPPPHNLPPFLLLSLKKRKCRATGLRSMVKNIPTIMHLRLSPAFSLSCWTEKPLITNTIYTLTNVAPPDTYTLLDHFLFTFVLRLTSSSLTLSILDTPNNSPLTLHVKHIVSSNQPLSNYMFQANAALWVQQLPFAAFPKALLFITLFVSLRQLIASFKFVTYFYIHSFIHNHSRPCVCEVICFLQQFPI